MPTICDNMGFHSPVFSRNLAYFMQCNLPKLDSIKDVGLSVNVSK